MDNGGFLSPSNVMNTYVSNTIETYKKENEKLQQENKQLKERLERIDNYLDKNYTMENQYWFDHIRDIVEDR